MRLASLGLNEYEQRLLTKQLKVLSGRTAAPWIYVGEVHEAELLIARDPAQVAGAGSVLLAQAGTHPSRAGDLCLEWPPRMFGLLELLLAAEKRLKVGASRRACAAEQLAGLKLDGGLEIDGRRILVGPRQDRLEAEVGSLGELIDLLLRPQLDLVAAFSLDLPKGEVPLPFQASFKSVIWALALRSGAHCGRNWAPHSLQFQLSAWPHFGEWEVAPHLLRLAALYTRKPASIASGCLLAATDEATVIGFLLACELCQVGVTKGYEKAPQPLETVVPPAGGLLQRLRERLGISFGRKG